MEHIGDELGINAQPSPTVSVSSGDESSHVKTSSEKQSSPKPNEDRFRKRKFLSTSIRSFFEKGPSKTTASAFPICSTSTEGSSSVLPVNREVKQWKDPVQERDKKRCRVAEKTRRARGSKSDTTKRTERVLKKIVDAQASRTGADLVVKEGRQSVVAEVMRMLKPQKTRKVIDESGHERTLQTSSQNFFHGEITATGKRKIFCR